MTDISVIGLGSMGSALAKTLLENGYSVTVWNRSIEKSEPLKAASAEVAETAKSAVAASPATITCIASHEQTIDLLRDLSESLSAKTIMELSTGGAEEPEKLAELLAQNDANWLIGIINAYPTAIDKDETVLTVVGEREVWQAWHKVITTLGGSSRHVGRIAKQELNSA